MNYPQSTMPPWQHQLKAWSDIQALSGISSGYYYAFDMGTGKSKSLIDDMNGHNVKKALILCPKSVVPVWPREFERHSHHPYTVITINDYPKSWSLKKKADKISQKMKLAMMRNERVTVVINYDAIIHPPFGPTFGKQNRIQQKGMLADISWDMVALDEAHRAKAPNSQTSWQCARIGKSSVLRRCLSGTPMPHSPLDIYAQFRFLDPDIYGTRVTAFKARYAIMGGFDMKQIVAWQNVEELNQKFKSRSHRVKKRDVLDLPPTSHEIRTCQLSPAASRIYSQLASEFIAQVSSGEISVDNALTKMLRLSQITSGCVKLDDGSEQFVCDEKINTLKEIIEDLDTDEPVLIFCRFTSELQRIKEMLRKLGRNPGEQSGHAADWESFQYNKKFDSLVVQIQSGNAGIDLTRACYCAFFSTGHSLGDYEQALARVDRQGQTRPITYYHIIAEGTVDATINQALHFKREVVEHVLNDVKAIMAVKKILTTRGQLRSA